MSDQTRPALSEHHAARAHAKRAWLDFARTWLPQGAEAAPDPDDRHRRRHRHRLVPRRRRAAADAPGRRWRWSIWSAASSRFFILRALGELVMYRPTSGSFVSYAREFLGEKAASSAGWMYLLTGR